MKTARAREILHAGVVLATSTILLACTNDEKDKGTDDSESVGVARVALGSIPPPPAATEPEKNIGVHSDPATPRPGAWAEYSARLSQGNALAKQLKVSLDGMDTRDAALEYVRLFTASELFVCGNVVAVKVLPAKLRGADFAKTTVTIAPSMPVLAKNTAVQGQVQFHFFGGTIAGKEHFTSATPKVTQGETACVFLAERTAEYWIAGKNAYLAVRPDSTVGILGIRATPAKLRDALENSLIP